MARIDTASPTMSQARFINTIRVATAENYAGKFLPDSDDHFIFYPTGKLKLQISIGQFRSF